MTDITAATPAVPTGAEDAASLMTSEERLLKIMELQRRVNDGEDVKDDELRIGIRLLAAERQHRESTGRAAPKRKATTKEAIPEVSLDDFM